ARTAAPEGRFRQIYLRLVGAGTAPLTLAPERPFVSAGRDPLLQACQPPARFRGSRVGSQRQYLFRRPDCVHPLLCAQANLRQNTSQTRSLLRRLARIRKPFGAAQTTSCLLACRTVIPGRILETDYPTGKDR